MKWQVSYQKEHELNRALNGEIVYLENQLKALQAIIADDKCLYDVHKEQYKRTQARLRRLVERHEECKDYLRECIFILRNKKITKRQRAMFSAWEKKMALSWRETV